MIIKNEPVSPPAELEPFRLSGAFLSGSASQSTIPPQAQRKKSANLMIDRIKSQTTIRNIDLVELSKTNFRVLLGPFNDINSLKESFEIMNSLNFENLEILKNV